VSAQIHKVFVVIVALFGLLFVFTTRWTVIDASKAGQQPAYRPHADRRAT